MKKQFLTPSALSLTIGLLVAIGPMVHAGELTPASAVPTSDPAPATPPANDPFGDSNPLDLIKRTVPANQKQDAGTLDFKGSLFLKLDANHLREAARLNPGNQMGLKKHDATVEGRTTLSSTLDSQRRWRWLFKGFASSADFRQGDGVIGTHLRADELFIDWKSNPFFASFGKRRVNWGHAQGFNVVNVVAPARDPLNPDYETEGQPMLWLSRGSSSTADLFFTRGNYRDSDSGSISGDKPRWGLRWSIPVGEADLALYYFDGRRYQNGLAFERMLGASFSANLMPGLSLYGELASFSHNYRRYFDANGAIRQKDGTSHKLVVGALWDLGGRSNLFAEVFYNGQGANKQERQSFWQAGARNHELLREFVPLAMNRRYALLGFKKEYREKYALNLNVLIAADRSTNLRIEGSYLYSDYFDLKGIISHTAGKQDSEFGSSMRNDAQRQTV